jgi:hypothetical protein
MADTRQIVTLRAAQTRQDQLDVRPLASGDSVPLRVSIDYQDEAGHECIWQRTLYLAVAETRQAVSERPGPESPLLPSNLDTVRRRLNRQFDDPELDAFCMDHFPTVFDKFSRGLRKDEKINLLLDHCRREPARYQQLLAVLEELGR